MAARSARKLLFACSRLAETQLWRLWRHAGREHTEKLGQLDLALEQARYEAARSRRQYEAVDPDNRLVAGELERRWNERLLAVRTLEDERYALLGMPETTVRAADRERLLALGSDLERAWDRPRGDTCNA